MKEPRTLSTPALLIPSWAVALMLHRKAKEKK